MENENNFYQDKVDLEKSIELLLENFVKKHGPVNIQLKSKISYQNLGGLKEPKLVKCYVEAKINTNLKNYLFHGIAN